MLFQSLIWSMKTLFQSFVNGLKEKYETDKKQNEQIDVTPRLRCLFKVHVQK